MKKSEWKIRQEIYHRLNREYDDDLKTKNVEITQNVTKHAIDYFKTRDIGWIYPSKSYMVGICYAKWLAEHFGGRPIEYLDDSDLLHGNDPYFVKYSDDPTTYIEILNTVTWDFDETSGLVPDVKEYFKKEFMLDD